MAFLLCGILVIGLGVIEAHPTGGR